MGQEFGVSASPATDLNRFFPWQKVLLSPKGGVSATISAVPVAFCVFAATVVSLYCLCTHKELRCPGLYLLSV